MNILRQVFSIGILLAVLVHADEWRLKPKRVIAEHGSDVSLLCTFQNGDGDEAIIQWLYQNITDTTHRKYRSHWRPLFLNAQSLTSGETRYSIQQKIQQINRTTITYSTILTLSKVTHDDEGLYMCKSFSSKTMEVAYQVQVIQSLDITPKQLFIPADETGLYSIELNCILRDNRTNRLHYEIYWWHNNRRLKSHTNRHARITKNVTQYSLISTLFYTGEPVQIVGKYICESESLRRYVSVQLQAASSSGLFIISWSVLLLWLLTLVFENETIN